MGQRWTKGDVAKIEAEIEMRRVELRPKLTAAVAEAAAKGTVEIAIISATSRLNTLLLMLL